MRQTELEPPLQAEALEEIERSLYSKLKAHRLSDSFIERCSEEAVQMGLVEYLRAIEEGVRVDNRDAFVVRAAFCRAIDELRREARLSDSAAVEAALESPRFAAPATEEIAIEDLAAAELHEAIETLSAEKRQALSLHYFDRLSDQRSAEILYCSERTFRRLLAKALGDLSRRLGVPAPEPGSKLAIEVGLVAWVSLRGARVAISHGPIEHLAGVIDGVRDGASWPIERLRDLATRLTASGASEKIGAVASGPAGKVAGGCLGAAALCVLGGVVGPAVVGNGGGHTGSHDRARAVRVATKAPPGQIATPSAAPPVAAPAAPRSPAAARSKRRRRARQGRVVQRAERRQVEAQTSGIARAGSESSSGTTAGSAAATETETVTVAPPSSSAPASSSEAAQAERQFGAFK
jgi:RNA polymerase sigma factor (sigma-70 family)